MTSPQPPGLKHNLSNAVKSPLGFVIAAAMFTICLYNVNKYLISPIIQKRTLRENAEIAEFFISREFKDEIKPDKVE